MSNETTNRTTSLREMIDNFKTSVINEGKQLLKEENPLYAQYIVNPQTKNKIKVSSALSYPANHPVHQAAQAFLSKNRSVTASTLPTNKNKFSTAKMNMTKISDPLLYTNDSGNTPNNADNKHPQDPLLKKVIGAIYDYTGGRGAGSVYDMVQDSPGLSINSFQKIAKKYPEYFETWPGRDDTFGLNWDKFGGSKEINNYLSSKNKKDSKFKAPKPEKTAKPEKKDGDKKKNQ